MEDLGVGRALLPAIAAPSRGLSCGAEVEGARIRLRRSKPRQGFYPTQFFPPAGPTDSAKKKDQAKGSPSELKHSFPQ